MKTWITLPDGSQTQLDYVAPYPQLPNGTHRAADLRDIDELTDDEFWGYVEQLIRESEDG